MVCKVTGSELERWCEHRDYCVSQVREYRLTNCDLARKSEERADSVVQGYQLKMIPIGDVG